MERARTVATLMALGLLMAWSAGCVDDTADEADQGITDAATADLKGQPMDQGLEGATDVIYWDWPVPDAPPPDAPLPDQAAVDSLPPDYKPTPDLYLGDSGPPHVVTCSATHGCKTNITCPVGKPCEVKCTGSYTCSGITITCPAGQSCKVTCSGSYACKGGSTIDCSKSSSCSVLCSGNYACKDKSEIKCGAGPCAVTCNQSFACGAAKVDCAKSCYCNIKCSGFNACSGMTKSCPTAGCGVNKCP